MRKIRVLLVEDHGIVREGLRLLLTQEDDLAVVGEAADGVSAMRALERLIAADNLDLALVDLGLPDMDGLAVVRAAKKRAPEVRVLILTTTSDDIPILGALEAGADGYLLKATTRQELVKAIRTAMNGDLALSPVIASRVVELARSRAVRSPSALSARELEVLHLLADGATSKAAAYALGLSAATVENHRARILAKLGATNLAAGLAVAYRDGLIAPSGQLGERH